MIQIDETKLSNEDLEYLDTLLYNRFQISKSHESKRILRIREVLGMDIQENLMHSDYEYEFNTKYEPLK